MSKMCVETFHHMFTHFEGGIALDRTTACNHITCKCSYQFCFVCKSKWGSCSTYSCSKFKVMIPPKRFTPYLLSLTDIVRMEKMSLKAKTLHPDLQPQVLGLFLMNDIWPSQRNTSPTKHLLYVVLFLTQLLQIPFVYASNPKLK